MKNIIKLSVIPLIILTLTACGMSPEKKFEKAIQKTNNSSYNMKTELTIGVKSSGVEMNVPIEVNTDYDANKKISKSVLSLNLMGMKMSVDSYMDLNDPERVVSYTNENKTWVKTVSQDYSSINDMILYYDKFEVKQNDSKETYYQVTVNKDSMKNIMNSFQGSEEQLENFKFTKDVVFEIYIDEKENYIKQIKADLKDSVQMDMSEENESELTQFNINVSYSKINDVKLDPIPDKIIKEALDKELIEIQAKAEEFIDEVEWKAWGDDTIKTFTDTNLTYDGPKPDKVDLKLENSEVVSGTLVISGYTITIKDGELSTPKK